MHSTTRRPRPQALAALALLLAAPAAGLAANEGDWGFRTAFRGYVYGGTGAPPITAGNGATCSPNPDTVRGGCDPKLAPPPTGIFGWTATDWDYALPTGEGTTTFDGTITFSRPDHLFVLAISDPIVTVASDGTAIVNVHVDLDSDLPTVPDLDERMNLGEFDVTSLVVTATTVTWELGNGAVTAEAGVALGGFLVAGNALDPFRIVLPFEEPAPDGTPITSTNILLKDKVGNPDKRGLTFVVSKEPGVVPANLDPTIDGATVRVVSSTFDDTYSLPASNWTAVIKKGVVAGYKYSDSKRLLGPISAAQIKDGGIKITGKGAGLSHTLDTEPADVHVVVSSGDESLCAGVGALSKKTYKAGKLFKGTKNPAPASCPDAPLPG